MDRRHHPLECDVKDLESLGRARAAAVVIVAVFIAMATFTPESRSVAAPVVASASSTTE
jgi:hypothetical protein